MDEWENGWTDGSSMAGRSKGRASTVCAWELVTVNKETPKDCFPFHSHPPGGGLTTGLLTPKPPGLTVWGSKPKATLTFSGRCSDTSTSILISSILNKEEESDSGNDSDLYQLTWPFWEVQSPSHPGFSPGELLQRESVCVCVYLYFFSFLLTLFAYLHFLVILQWI